MIGRVLVSEGSLKPTYLSRTPRKGARPSFWTAIGTPDSGASTLLTGESFPGLSTCARVCVCVCVRVYVCRQWNDEETVYSLVSEVAKI